MDIRIPDNMNTPPLPGAKSVATGVAMIFLLLVFFTSWFQIGADSVGVVLRFGKYSRTVGPGLHLMWPLNAERVFRVPIQKQFKDEFGFRTERAGVQTQYSDSDFSSESMMLTGDLNVVDVRWSVQYRINDPKKYLFRVRNVNESFRFLTEAVMHEVVGDRTVNEVLTVGRTDLADSVQTRLQKLCDEYETGIRVDQVILQDITPPDPVKPSFDEVNQAQQEKDKLINKARSKYNAEIPRARGQAKQQIQQAQGYAIDRVNRAKGDAQNFRHLYAAYRRAPLVTRRRMYIETMDKVLPKIDHKVIVDDSLKQLLPLLHLGGGTSK